MSLPIALVKRRHWASVGGSEGTVVGSMVILNKKLGNGVFRKCPNDDPPELQGPPGDSLPLLNEHPQTVSSLQALTPQESTVVLGTDGYQTKLDLQ